MSFRYFGLRDCKSLISLYLLAGSILDLSGMVMPLQLSVCMRRRCPLNALELGKAVVYVVCA